MNAIFACGGTGGHIFPAIAIAEKLALRKDVNILFVGSYDGMEKNIIKKYNYNFIFISAKPLIRAITIKNIINTFFNIKAIFESFNIIKKFNPDIVIGTGGFVSFPVLIAAVLSGRKTLIHEPNVYPGIANRVLGLFVTKITTGFKETKKYFCAKKTRVTGNPVRNSILHKNKNDALKYFKLDRNKKTILIMPGSRAARKINDIVALALKKIEEEIKNIQIIWMAGKVDCQKIKKIIIKSKIKIRVFDFIYDSGLAYVVSDVAILRAGASTLAEIVALQIPSILIPYPYATDNHQEKNAMLFKKNNAAIVIKDNELNDVKLIESLKYLLNNKNNKTIRENIKKLYVKDSVEEIINFMME
ncbi:MAG: undecaprenyldiphospho-muramoylpentapeptide beta-N-acetylglucosaminyltransferase [Candidatus Goldbacteria bacterium]|nr:undecaprenyldiphospho-muramoylpentapeptide beta-N-acetylglucosaminyltransferase [Candidatus Goldiibacteriota bacterium]